MVCDTMANQNHVFTFVPMMFLFLGLCVYFDRLAKTQTVAAEPKLVCILVVEEKPI